MEELPVYIPRPKICHMAQYQCCKRHRDCPLYPRCSQIQFLNTVCCQDCPNCTYADCSLTPQQRQEQPVYISHVIQQERLELNLKARRWQEQQAHIKQHRQLYEYYNNLFGDRLERKRQQNRNYYWADPERFRAKRKAGYKKQHPKAQWGQKQTPLDMLPNCGLDCFNCPFEDCTLPEDWFDRKSKERQLQRMRRYYEEHKEGLKAKMQVYGQEHREEIRAYKRRYYEEHKEEIRAYKQRYQQKHREEIRVRKQRYGQEHREEICAQKKQYYWEHHDEISAKRKQRYLEKKKEKHQEKEENT